jgi:superfamily II DNA or RNA helicase
VTRRSEATAAAATIGAADVGNYFERASPHFSLLRSGPLPVRSAQLGALHAIGSHFTLHSTPVLVALPTGVGKTVVAAAAPFLIPDVRRVLFVVPTRVLRQDAVDNLKSQRQLRGVSLLGAEAGNPKVVDVDGRPTDWDVFDECDVAVALPNSLFELVESNPPPRDLFDVIVFDEAHHVPARTWSLIAGAFEARIVMLTATPYRRDARDLPGELVYSYPLSKAIEDGAYVPIELIGVETIGLSEADRDEMIARKAVEVLRSDQHSSTDSRLLVRAATKNRVDELARLYERLGLRIHVVHSGLTPATVERRIAEVRSGEVDGVAFVGVLGEGFDCPELKVGAYHDKHKSLPVTLQFLGRLSRVCSSAGPPEVVASIETLRNDTSALWRRDSDWSSIIPALAASAADGVDRRKRLIAEMDPFPRGEVALADVAIRPSVGLYEVDRNLDLASDDQSADFGLNPDDVAAAGLAVGHRLGDAEIIWTYVSTGEQLLLFVTRHVERPDWLRSSALDGERFEMHAALVRSQPDGTPIVVVSSTTRSREAEILAILTGSAENYRLASPEFMRRFLSAAEIDNIQHLGSRNAAGGSQARTYTTNSGKAVEDGIAYDDLSEDVIGHVGAQCRIAGEDYNGGVSISNSRVWINKGFEIDRFVGFFDDLLNRMGAGQPGEIRRLAARFEQNLTSWPTDTDVLAIALDEFFLVHVNDIGGVHPADVDLRAEAVAPDRLRLVIEHVGWTGDLRPNGSFASSSGDLWVTTDAGDEWLESLLTQYPPTIYFRDGCSARAQRLVPASIRQAAPPLAEILDSTWDWADVNIRHETRRPHQVDSIHERVEQELTRQYPASWIVTDDGSGEIADHIVFDEIRPGELTIRLIHSKASSEPSTGIRTKDLDELVQQIIRSKRWLALGDRMFWERFAIRLRQRASTSVVQCPAGSEPGDLIEACRKWSETPPIITVEYVGVQPGLAAGRLATEYANDPSSHARVAETIGACASWIGSANASLRIVGT